MSLSRTELEDLEARLNAMREALESVADSSREAGGVVELDQTRQGRLVRGEYGECLRCGEAIAFRRLQADPAATLCIDCAE